MTSSEAEDSSELDAYISGGANLFGLLSATVTGSLKLLDKDKGIMNIFLYKGSTFTIRERLKIPP